MSFILRVDKSRVARAVAGNCAVVVSSDSSGHYQHVGADFLVVLNAKTIKATTGNRFALMQWAADADCIALCLGAPFDSGLLATLLSELDGDECTIELACANYRTVMDLPGRVLRIKGKSTTGFLAMFDGMDSGAEMPEGIL